MRTGRPARQARKERPIPRSRRCAVLLLALIWLAAGCAVGTSKPEAAGPAAFRWAAGTARPVAEFDPAGASLVAGGGRIRVGFHAWGRTGALARVGKADPVLPALPRGDAPGGRRVEYRYDGVVAWYGDGEDAIELGFDVISRPAGGGPLVLELALPGLQPLPAGDGEALFTWQPPWSLRVHGLAAWDARGRSLPASFQASPGRLALVVADAGAEYPLLVDPYLSSVVAWQYVEVQEDASSGMEVASAGDVDRDGYDDLLVGLPGWDGDQYGEGAALIFPGSATGLASTATWLAQGDQQFAFLGTSVAGVGDVGGDGYDDVLVGVPGWDGEWTDQGAARLYAGGPGGPSSTPAWTAEGPGEGAMSGWSVAAAGDLDNNALADIAVGAPWSDQGSPGSGLAQVFLGALGGLPEEPDWTWTVIGAAEAGAGLGGSGDVDGDGFGDLLVGTPGWSNPEAAEGAAWLFLGSATGLLASPTWSFEPDLPAARAGDALSLSGDFDGDGFSDAVVGGPGWGDARPAEGAVWVFHGSATGLPAVFDWAASSGQVDAELGAAVAAPGDLDGDGFEDLVVGAPHSGNEYSGDVGSIRAWAGSAGGLFADPGAILYGPHFLSSFGESVAGAGDVDGDGRADLAVGAPFLGTPQGAAFVYLGLDAAMDLDGDGWCGNIASCPGGLAPGDCDDADPSRHPGATEVCDGADDDCDGTVPADEADADADGWRICDGDCDDAVPTTFPGNAEICDGIDQDCDGVIDEGAPPIAWFPDADMDGFGDSSFAPLVDCVPPDGWTQVPGDCDDDDPAVNPGVPEATCNDLDDDCEPDTADVVDLDHDGFSTCDCEDLQGGDCGDCDDHDKAVNPGMDEACGDEIDQDCDGADLVCPDPPVCDEPSNLCRPRDCACEQGGPPGPAALLLLPVLLALGARRRRGHRAPAVPLAAAVLLAASQAMAAPGDIDTMLLRPSFAPRAFLAAPGADPGRARTFRLGATFQYEHAPILVLDHDTEDAWLVALRASGTIGGWVTIVDGLGAELSLPFCGQQGAWDGRTVPGFAMGDVHGRVLWRFARVRDLSLALSGEAFLPTSTRDALLGERRPRGGLALAAGLDLGRFGALLSPGVLFRNRVRTGYDLDMASELVLLVALRLDAARGLVSFMAEVETRGSLVEFMKHAGESPAELRIGAAIRPLPMLRVDLAGGIGLGPGYGAPLFRILAGVTVLREPEPPPEPIVEVDLEPEPPPQPRPQKAPPPPPEPEPEPEPPPLAQVEGRQITINEPIRFEYDSDVLLPESFPVLDAVRGIIQGRPEIAHVLVEGHASVEGTVAYNWDLSNRRAASVFRYLVEGGVNARRLSYRGMGEAAPAEDLRAGRVIEDDRRVEFHIVRELAEWIDDLPDWERTAPPVPWAMPEEELAPAETEALPEAGAPSVAAGPPAAAAGGGTPAGFEPERPETGEPGTGSLPDIDWEEEERDLQEELFEPRRPFDEGDDPFDEGDEDLAPEDGAGPNGDDDSAFDDDEDPAEAPGEDGDAPEDDDMPEEGSP